MTTVEIDPELGNWFLGCSALSPVQAPTKQTDLASRIQNVPVDTVTRTGHGWFRPMWHRFDGEIKPIELHDPKGLHGKAGGLFVMSECGMVACPDEFTAPISTQDCPVCFPDDSGHLFVWLRRDIHAVATCIRTNCEKTDDETRDRNTGRRRACGPDPVTRQAGK